ncbi:MAG TPA: NUDIX hydrolase [Myxococcales bacterium]|nr:NUDIX hydrolase [Myxococcales bacterium]
MIDPAIRTAYRVAHAMLRSYWFVRRPHTSGALVALWHDGKVLLVKSSYRRQYTLPGGYVRPGEAPRDAAARELREEVGLDVASEALELGYHGTKTFEHRQDTLDIYELEVEAPPEHQVDRREVIWAGFVTPEQARGMDIVPHLAEYLEDR